MQRTGWRRWLPIAALLLVLIVNGLANTLPLNGLQTGEISDRFEVYFVPAGYVFSIWGLIYLGLIGYAIYQALPAQRDDPRLAAIDALFVVSCVANALWLVFWHYLLFTLSVLAMLLLLACLLAIYVRLGIGRSTPRAGERWLVRAPFSLYLGWITVATVANITSWLDVLGWGGWGIGEAAWAAILLAVALLIASAVVLTRRDVIYGLVIIWAYIGIAVKFPDTLLVSVPAWLGVAILVGEIVAVLLKRGPAGASRPV